MVDLGAKIKALRVSKGLTQQQLAKQLGITKSVISAYENATRFPSFDVLIKTAQLFHVSTDFLLGMKKGVTVDVSGLSQKDVELVHFLIERLKKNKEPK